jgi:hypothetical protein
MIRFPLVDRALCATAVLAGIACGQCSVQTSTTALPQLAVIEVSDRDGPGPLPARVLVADITFTPTTPAVPNSSVGLLDPATNTIAPLGGPLPFAVKALAELADGRVVAAGTKYLLGIQPIGQLAFWDGTTWSFHPDFPVYQGIESLRRARNGDLLVGGSFATIGGIAANGVARYDGSNWTTLGAGPGSGTAGTFVTDLQELADGSLVATGTFQVAVGTLNLFWEASVKRWTGSAWQELGDSPYFRVQRLLERDNGELLAIGPVQLQPGAPPVHVVRWDGATWNAMTAGYAGEGAVVELPSGDLAIGGLPELMRWNGASWVPLVDNPTAYVVLRMATLPDGSLLASNSFATFRVATTCPASVSTYGSGCVGSAGPVAIAAASPPWAGSAFTARGSGIPSSALVLSVYGFQPLSLPLSAALPQALPGCQILMTADLLDVLLPSAGLVDTVVALPNALPLVGQTFYHYVVPLELAPNGDLVAVTSSNALAAVIGSF